MNSKKPIEKCDAILRPIFSFNCDTIEMCAVNLNVCSNVRIVRWFYTWDFASISTLKKTQQKITTKGTLLLKFGLCLLLCKVVCFLRDDGRKQIFDINLIGVILICVIDIRDSTVIANMFQIEKI